jgi:hypothetical protein
MTMARKTGKNSDGSPLPEKDRDELLDELASVQDMLSEDNNKGTPDQDPPVLEPESPGEPLSPGTEEQMPLLQPDAHQPHSDPANNRLRQALSERPNPFLSDAARNTDPQNRATTPSADQAPGERSEPPATAQAPMDASAAASGLGENEMRALVDEILAAWMPRIERELRDKLMERLRNQ